MTESMPALEISAKSVQEATQLAADKLGVSADRVHVTVLEETKGLFGKSSVRVRAEVIADAPAAPAPASKSKKSAPEPGPTPEETLEEVQGAVDASVKPDRSRSRRGKRPVEAESAPAEAPKESAPEVAVADEPPAATQEDAEAIQAILREMLEAAGVQVSVSIGQLNGQYVSLTLDGKDAAFLVGKHGEVLNALQYLVNIVAGRRLNKKVRATLDGNDYRRRREEALTQLATKIAEQVKSRGEEAVLDALPAFERRIVHKALSGIDGITTYSEGEEPTRRVVIAPAD